MQNKILIIGSNWVGDTVMSQCLFKLLKQQNPALQIDVLAMHFLHPLLRRMPEVNNLFELNISHGELALSKRYHLGKLLKKENYQQAIVLPNSFKSALIPFFAKIPKRTGWKGEWRYILLNDLRQLDKRKYQLMIERFMALGLPKKAVLQKPYPNPHLNIDEKSAHASFKKFELEKTNKKILAICPGAEYGPAKRWPAEYFLTIAKEQIAKDWQVWLFGSTKDREIAQMIQVGAGDQCINLAGKTDLGEAIDLLSLSNLVLTNDSGLMHIANALNLPVIVIYGSTSPEFTPPLNEKVTILKSKINCSPCFERTCRFGHYQCLKETSPAVVFNSKR